LVEQVKKRSDAPLTQQATATGAFGQRLRQARITSRMTQSELANGNFSVSYISAVERGQIRPSLGALEKLAARLHVPVYDLLRADGGVGPGLRAEMFGVIARDDIALRRHEAHILTRRGMPQEALRALDALRGRDLSLRDHALIGWQRAQCALALKEVEQARQEAHEALAYAERLDEPELREQIRLTLGEALALSGQRQAALTHLHVAREAAENGSVPDPLFRLRALYLLGTTCEQAGDLDGAAAILDEAATLAHDVLNPERLADLYWQVAEQLRAVGDQRRAQQYTAQCMAAYEEAESQHLAGQTLTSLGHVYAQTGRLDDARAILASAQEWAELQQDSRALVEALTELSGIYLREQHYDDAARAAERALEFAASAQNPVQEGAAHVVLARVLEARGDEAAAQRFERAIERLKAADATYPLSDAYAQYSAYLERQGNSKRALEILRDAWQLRERAGARDRR
jgi:tetratricopeptide (TPR) repeat protein